MSDKREIRKDLPKREFDSDLNSPALSNYDDPPVDQRDSDDLRDHIGNPGKKTPVDELQESGKQDGHDVGNADNLVR